jgi:hypothetical protein
MATFVEELLARLALDVDGQSFKKGERGMDDLAASAVEMGAVIGAAFAAVQAAAVGLVVNYANNAKQVENLSRVAGEGFESFQLYAAGAKTVGVEQDKLADIFKDTNDKVGDFLQTGAGPLADFFENIGPRVGITADMFKDLSGKDALQLYVDGLERANLNQAEMTYYMEKIASDSTMLLPLLANGGAGFSAMADEALAAGSVISESGAKSAKALNTSFAKLQMWITGLGYDIAEELIPTVTEVVDGIRKFIKENKALISSTITGTIKAAAVALKGLAVAAGLFLAFKLGMAVIAAAKGVMILSAAFKAARLGALLMNAAVLMFPILIGLAIAAVALLADDMYSFFQGGESYIGDFVAQWPMLGEAIYAVGDALQFAWKFAKDMFDLLYAIVTLDFSAMGDAFGRVIENWKSMLLGFVEFAASVLPDGLKDAFGFGSGESTGGESAASGVPGLPGDVSMLGAPALPSVPLMMPMQAAQVASAGSNTTKQEDNRVYNITGTDIGEVKRVLNEKNAFAAKTIDTGVQY